MPAHAAGSGFRRNRQGGHPDRPERHPRPGEQFRTAQRPRHRHPNATGPPAPGHRQIACCCRGRKAARSPHPSQDVQASPGTYPWRLNITATVFWVGEEPTERNPVANHKSSWDSAWRENFGGFDNPDPVCRTRDFRPKTFIPRQNPFYVALPYNDVSRGEHKAEASRVIPWFRREYAGKGQSVCKGRWVQIVYNKRSCFAQWEDCGPFTTEDWPYVFGDKPPVNTQNKGAGIDISPAVRDYLGITGGTAIVHWRFVEFYRIPRGPWSKYGDNNPFVNAGLGAGKKSLQLREDRLRQQQEAIQRELLKDPAKLRRELQG